MSELNQIEIRCPGYMVSFNAGGGRPPDSSLRAMRRRGEETQTEEKKSSDISVCAVSAFQEKCSSHFTDSFCQWLHESLSCPPWLLKPGSVVWSPSCHRTAGKVRGQHQTAPYKAEGSAFERCRGKPLWRLTVSLCVDCKASAALIPYIWAEDRKRRECKCELNYIE